MLQLPATTLRQLEPPAEPVLELDAVKLHLRLAGDAEDALLAALLASATLEAEHLMGRAIMPQRWQATFDAFAPQLVLRRARVTSVESITCIAAADGAEQQLEPEAWQLVNAGDFVACLVPAYGTSWPATRAQPEAVRVVFICGYADAAAVPEPIKSWIKLRIGALYENREGWTLGKAIEPNPFIDRLLDPYRVWSA